jgi:hypothetical protein
MVWSIQMFFFRMRFFFPKMTLYFLFYTSRAHVTTRMHFALSSRVTVPQGHFCKWEQLSPLGLWGLPGTGGLYTMACSCWDIARATPLRVQNTGKQEWEVWPRGIWRLSLTPGPYMPCLTINTSSDLPSQEILCEKQSLDLAGAPSQKESLQSQQHCLISTSV